MLNLEDCYYVPTLTKNIVSVYALIKKGFHLTLSDNCCSIMLNNVIYANGTLNNGIYILDMSNLILTIHDNKRQRQYNLKLSYLWHCRLGHISEKRMSKLHKDGSLGSFDYESYDTCESCLLGKMTKLPFKGKGERASKPLDKIHTCMWSNVHAC